jgi:hypothetical protein
VDSVFTSVNCRVSLTILKAVIDENLNLSSANMFVQKLDIRRIGELPNTQFTNIINLGLLVIFMFWVNFLEVDNFYLLLDW